MMNGTVLDIVLEYRKAGDYALRLSVSRPESEGGTQVQVQLQLRPDELRDLAEEPVRYGQALRQALRADEKARRLLGDVWDLAHQDGGRVRLRTDTAAPELQALYWETLLQPEDGSSTAVSPIVRFSRYVSNDAVHLRSRGELRALAAVVGPRSLTLQPGGWLPSPHEVPSSLPWQGLAWAESRSPS